MVDLGVRTLTEIAFAVCQARETVEDWLRMGAVGNLEIDHGA